MQSLNNCSKEELIKIINSLKKQKKFGLVWEDKPEKVAIECEQKLPVLKEVEEKAITEAGKSAPTNIIIEGDNYHALSVLNYTHAGRIDVIYIDPPYNTGNKDFTYNDRFIDREDSFRHSKWLSFINKRLLLAKELLNITGVIFISIDDNELSNLNLLCNQIFGEHNFIGLFSVENNPKGRKNGKFISVTNEYCLAYARNFDKASFSKIIPKHANDMEQDENGDYIRRSGKRVLMGENTLNKLVDNFNSAKHYTAYIKDNDIIFRQERNLEDKDSELIANGYTRFITHRNEKFVENTYTMKKFEELFKNGALDIRESKIYEKHFSDAMQIKSMLTNNEYYAIVRNKKVKYKIDLKSTSAKQELSAMFKKEVFSFPKNVNFIQHLISLHPNNNATALDFFAGSGTTGQAVMELNQEDGGNRQFILCTNNENQIAEDVTYPRIKTVVTGIREDGSKYSDGIPANVRYFKTDFVEKDKTLDKLRRKLSPACEDMIRIREGAYEKIIDEDMLKVYKNSRGLTAIIYDRFELEEHLAKIEELETDEPIHLYVFSYTKYDRLDEIEKTLKHTYISQPIPEGVLEIYKRIFNQKGGKR